MIRDILFHIQVAFLTSVLFTRDAGALPDGAPVCVVGTYAPDPAKHKYPFGGLGRKYNVTIGGAVLRLSETLKVPSGVDLPFIITQTDVGDPFKGVLAIVNNPNIPLLNSLLPKSDDVKVQEQCPPQGYSGITHKINFEKNSVEGTLRLNTDVEAFLDINIVVVNVAHQSIYFYDRFTIASYGIPPVPVSSAPVRAPTATPVSLPLPVPVPVPLPMPMPVPLPVSSAPVLVPVPMARPNSVPSPAPIPIQGPIPTPTPAGIPPTSISAPSSTPTLAPNKCGFLGLSIFCFSGCGVFRRLLNLCD